MRVSGYGGILKAGGRDVATLRDWSMEHVSDGSILHSTIVPISYYWLEHAARFDVHLTVGKHIWRWRDVVVQVQSGHMRAETKGGPEIYDT